MLTPRYSAPVTVGGTDQSVQFSAFPDELISRQSGDVTIIHSDALGFPFDISSLSGSDFKSVPFGSGQTPVTLAVGVTGFTREIFTLITSGTPDTSGTFILRVAGEDTAAIPYNADDAAILAALIALPSRTGGDFLVARKAKENLGFAGAQILVETSGGFAIDFSSTLDGASLPTASISLSIEQKGSNIENEYNANWDKDSIPAAYSDFDFDKKGAIAFYIALEDGDDFYQVYQRLNIVDDAFVDGGGTIPSSATYVYNPNDPSAWLRITTSSPVIINEGMDKLIAKNFRDFGAVLDIQTTPPGSPADGDAYLVSSVATGDWAGQEDQIARWSSTLAAWAFTNVHRNGDEILNLNDSSLYRWSGSAWVIVSGGAGDVVGPGSAVDDNIATYNGITGKIIKDSGVGIAAITANTAKTTNATHTGDATGATALTLQPAAITGKPSVTLSATDLVLIADVSDSNSLKQVPASEFMGSGTDPDAIHDNVAGEIAAITAKATPVSGDFLLIEDSADSNNKKRITIGDLPGGGASLPVSDSTSIVEGNTDDTKLMRIDVETNVATATTRVLSMPDTDVNIQAQGRSTSLGTTGAIEIDWNKLSVIELGTLTGNVTLTFINVSQDSTINLTYTTTGGFDVTLPGSVLVLNGGASTAASYNSIFMTATNAATEQQAAYSTDSAAAVVGGGILPSAVDDIDDADYTVLIGDVGLRKKLINGTVQRDFTFDVSLLADFSEQISFKNASDFSLRIVVSNTGTMTLGNGFIDLYLSKGEIVTFEGDTATNADILARP